MNLKVQGQQLTSFNLAFIFVGSIFILLNLTATGCLKRVNKEPIQLSTEELLFRASASGDISEVRRLLDLGTNVDAREEEGETPLMYAAVNNKTDVVRFLLDRGAAVNAVSKNDETALVRTVGTSHQDCVTLLLDRGANIEESAPGNGTPLMQAAGNGDLKMIKLLLDRGAKVNALDDEGFSALTAAVSRRASPEAVRMLLYAGAKIDVKNNRGETPLMIAKRNGEREIVSLLAKRAKGSPPSSPQ